MALDSSPTPVTVMPNPAPNQPGLLVIISGPSGVGKTTIARRVEHELGGEFSRSFTTRPPTPGGVLDKNYVFVDRDEFDRRREQGEFMEWAEVHGNCYGTPRGPVEDALAQGRLMILEIDVEGAIQIKSQLPTTYALFVLPPSEDVLLERLRRRGREDETVIQRRFAKARQEIARARESGVYDTFVVNQDLETAVRQAIAIVQDAWTKRR